MDDRRVDSVGVFVPDRSGQGRAVDVRAELTHRLRMQFETIRHNGLAWRFYEAGSGEPVVLFHGFPDTPQSYEAIANALVQSGRRVIIPYLRG